MQNEWIFGRDWCDCESAMSVGKCGLPSPGKNGRCVRHKEMNTRPKRALGAKFSGDSKWRENQGMYQAKAGR